MSRFFSLRIHCLFPECLIYYVCEFRKYTCGQTVDDYSYHGHKITRITDVIKFAADDDYPIIPSVLKSVALYYSDGRQPDGILSFQN